MSGALATVPTASLIRPAVEAPDPAAIVSGRCLGSRALQALSWLVPVLVLLVWEMLSRTGWLEPQVLPAPSRVAGTAWDLTVQGRLPHDLGVSLLRAAVGFVIGGSIGFALGTLVGFSRVAEAVLDRSIQVVRAIPFLALLPLVIVWFGIDEGGKIFLVALGVAFPIWGGRTFRADWCGYCHFCFAGQGLTESCMTITLANRQVVDSVPFLALKRTNLHGKSVHPAYSGRIVMIRALPPVRIRFGSWAAPAGPVPPGIRLGSQTLQAKVGEVTRKVHHRAVVWGLNTIRSRTCRCLVIRAGIRHGT